MKMYKSYKLSKLLKLTIFFITLSLLLIFSKTNFSVVRESVNLFLSSIVPSLFPFIFFTEIILKTDVINLLTRLFGNVISKIFKVSKNSVSSIIIGFLCGFPMGAKTVSTLYKEDKISKKDADILLSFVNNCNPAFILSTIGIAVFNNLTIGIILLVSHLISSILIGIIYSKKYISTNNIIHKNMQNYNNTYNKSCNNSIKNINWNVTRNENGNKNKNKNININKNINKNNDNFFYVVKTSILNSFVTLGNILGFIIIFNLLSNLTIVFLEKINLSNYFTAIVSAIFEITNGCNKISMINFDYKIKICIVSFVLGFSGLCILAQIYSTICEQGFKFTSLLKSKLVHGILSSIITYIILTFIDLNLETVNVYSNVENANAEYTYYINNMKTSYLISTFAISLILLIYFICTKYIVIKKKGRKVTTLKKGA